MGQFSISEVGHFYIAANSNGLFLDRGVDVDPLQVLFGHVLFAFGRFDGYLEQLLHPLGADAFAPLDQGGRIEGKLVLEVLEAAEVLPVTIFDELGHHRLVTHVVGMLEVVQPYQQPDRQSRATDFGDVEGTELFVKDRPVDGVGQTEQGVSAVKDLIESGPEQISLASDA